MQFRNSPIQNWVDRNSRNRIINQVILEEYYNPYNSFRSWEQQALSRLLSFGIEISEATVRLYVKQILNNKRDPVCASAFNNSLAARSGKEIMYGQMDLLEKTFLSGPLSYIGLPANQILKVISKYDQVYACERDGKMYRYMKFLNEEFHKKSETHIINQDIFKFLCETPVKFNVFDLDLMTFMDERCIEKIATLVNRSSQEKFVICIVSCIGRKITHRKYESLMPSVLINNLECKLISSYSGSYCDQVVPMRYELLVMEKENG